jgi:hypothetical protein
MPSALPTSLSILAEPNSVLYSVAQPLAWDTTLVDPVGFVSTVGLGAIVS